MLYPTWILARGCPEGHFGRNQLSPHSIGFSPLIPGHPSDSKLNIGIGPPRAFRPASAYPGLDRAVSGLAPVTTRPFRRRPWPLAWLRACCFRYGYLLTQLASPQAQTPCPVFRNGRHNSVSHRSYTLLAQFSFTTAPFEPWLTITNWFRDLFTFGEEYFSAFSHLTLFTIGLARYLEFAVDASDLPPAYPSRRTQFLQSTLQSSPTGLSPFVARRSRQLRLDC